MIRKILMAAGLLLLATGGQATVLQDTVLSMHWSQHSVDSLLNICRPLAQTDVKAAEEKLLRFKQQHFGFPAELYIAQLYDAADKKGTAYRAEVAHAYDQMSLSLMSQGDMELYVLSLFYSGRNDDCAKKAREALAYYPQSLPLNRYFFRSLVSQGHYRESLAAYDKLTRCMPAIMEHSDTVHYAMAMNNLAKSLTKAGQYEEAERLYAPYVERCRAEKRLTDDMVFFLADNYISWAGQLDSVAKRNVLQKADKLLAQRIPETKVNDDLFAYMRVALVDFQLDPEAQSGVAVPAIRQMEKVFKSKGALDELHKERLVMGYRYMMSYFFLEKEDYKTAKAYTDKLLALEPDNESALQLKGVFDRAGIK